MKKLLFFLLLLLPLIVFIAFFTTPKTQAADIRSKDMLTIGKEEQNLRDLYLFGSKIDIAAPVTNDLVMAGGTITASGPVTGSLMVAGGTLDLRSPVEGSLRAAGGNITIDEPVGRDLVVAGGNITVTNNARINGDLIFTGGNLTVNGPVSGKIIANGGQVALNSTVGGNVEGNMGMLRIGNRAAIRGDLNYSSSQKATIENGAVISGKQTFHQTQKEQQPRGISALITLGSLYNLLTEIVISLLFVYFLGRFLTQVIERVNTRPVYSGAVGFGLLILLPLASVLLLLLFLLGIISFIFYIFLLLVSVFVGKILAGWWVMHWYERRQKNREYMLDWKAAVVGPIVIYILMLIPIIGWLISFIIFLVALGGVAQQLLDIFSGYKAFPAQKAPAAAVAPRRERVRK